MCGICGVTYSQLDKPVDLEMLRRMTDIMTHRGPDSEGFYVAPGVGLGIRRLSIIDLQTGDQPISNEDGTITVVCNGEIYNFQELRRELMAAGHRFRTRSDIEVIVHLYEDHGVQCVNHLRGMFGFALWDARQRRLMLARDRVGIKPLSYALENDALFFGSELKSILMSGKIERELDATALGDILTMGFALTPKTLFRRIRRLRPGHYLIYQDGNLSIHKYWDMNFPAPGEHTHQRSPQEWAESLREKLEESVRIHLRSDVPVGAWLSGGIDSSGITSLMSQLSKGSVQTFTLAFENPMFDEVSREKILSDFPSYKLSNQQAVCTSEDFNLLPQAVWHCEDPFALGVAIPGMLLSELASRSVKVVLTGDGADEVFGGYAWFRTEKLFRPLATVPLGIRRLIARIPAVRKRWSRASRLMSLPDKMNLSRYTEIVDSPREKFTHRLLSDDLIQRLDNEKKPEEILAVPEEFERWHPFTQLQYLEMKSRLPDYITRDLDAASMAYSLELRVPFLDHEFVEFCAQIPPALKMRRLQEKYILRQALRNDLPVEILGRRKRGLTSPFEQWVGNLPEFAKALLSEDRLRERGYFNPKFVVHMIEQHRSGKTNYGKSLMRVLGVHLWDELFVRGCRPLGQ